MARTESRIKDEERKCLHLVQYTKPTWKKSQFYHEEAKTQHQSLNIGLKITELIFCKSLKIP